MHVCILFLPLHRVSSSEKVDKYGRYVDFNIASIPYPGTITCGAYLLQYVLLAIE